MYFILCLLFNLLYSSYALTYDQCIDHKFNQTNIDLYADSNIHTGRYDDCIISCDQRYYYKLVCYSEYSYHYDAWWAFQLMCSIGLLYYSLDSLRYMIRAESDSRPKLNPQFITIGSNIFISLIKIIWVACIFNGRDDSNIVGGLYLDIVIIKLVQCINLSEIFLLIIVWKTIIISTTNLKKIDNSVNNKNYIYTTTFISIIMFIIFPLSIIGKNIQIFNTISNISVIIIMIGLIIASITYSFKLTKILNNGVSDLKRKNAIINIKFVNNSLCTCGIVACIMTFLNVFRLFEYPIIKLWLWITCIHMIEFVSLTIIAYSTSHKARNHNSSSNSFSFSRISTFKSNKNNRINSASTVVSTNRTSSLIS